MQSESDGQEWLAPGLRRVTAPNPSPMTFTGTQTYIIGEGRVVVIDPGPALPSHLQAILGALAPGEQVDQILITHSHLDHSPLARALAEATGAPILAAGGSDWGRRPVMEHLAAAGLVGGGEGIDGDFAPDRQIADGTRLEGDWGVIEAIATPGHMANHLCFAWNGALFSGDLVMGWSTSLVSPPDGDMTAFMASCARLIAREERVYYPGHGEPIPDGPARTRTLIDHRTGREAQILEQLKRIGRTNVGALTRAIYTDIDPALLPAAERNVLAHLIDLHEKSIVVGDTPLRAEGPFQLA